MFKSLSVLLGFMFAIILNNYVGTSLISYLDTNDVDDFENIPPEIQKKIEIQGLVYTHSYNDLEDVDLCSLSNEKKISLCEKIFNLYFYKYEIHIHLNKIAFYRTNLKCEEKLVISRFFQDQENITRIMYPCFGRYSTIRTSFIEDDFYNLFYLSVGTRRNSIIVYMYDNHSTSESFYFFDFIRNVDLSNLENVSITEKDVILELKLYKRTVTTIRKSEVADLFIKEQDYLKDDPVCDLEYEKKMTLCNIIFNHSFYQETNIILNSFASYLFNMDCIIRSVYYHDDTLEESFLLRDEQKLFSCYARRHNSGENVFTDNLLKAFYVSRGPRKNSIVVYFCLPDGDKIISIAFMTENINFRALKPTIITNTDLMIESYSAYLETEKIMQSVRKEYDEELTYLYIAANNEKEEFEFIRQLVDTNEKNMAEIQKNININNNLALSPNSNKKKKDVQFYYGYYGDYLKENVRQIYFKEEDTRESKSVSLLHILYDKSLEGKSFSEIQKSSSVSEYAQLGPQTFKRVLDMKKLELSNKNIIALHRSGAIEEMLLHKNGKRTISDEKLIDEIKTLTTKMRLFVIKRNVKEALAMRNETNKEKDIIHSEVVSATEEKLQQEEDVTLENKSKLEKTRKVSQKKMKSKKKKNFK